MSQAIGLTLAVAAIALVWPAVGRAQTPIYLWEGSAVQSWDDTDSFGGITQTSTGRVFYQWDAIAGGTAHFDLRETRAVDGTSECSTLITASGSSPASPGGMSDTPEVQLTLPQFFYTSHIVGFGSPDGPCPPFEYDFTSAGGFFSVDVPGFDFSQTTQAGTVPVTDLFLRRGTVTYSLRRVEVGGENPPEPPACDDGRDNDHDGKTDFPADPDCTSAQGTFEGFPACLDGLDNDRDGKVDREDPGCLVDPFGASEEDAPQCVDLRDNDGDGLTDYPADPGCSSATDNDESNPPACSDGLDNDGDSKVDFPADDGCTSASDNDEGARPVCDDSIDNDGDGKVDFPSDPGCTSSADSDETDELQCDAESSGYEATATDDVAGQAQFRFSIRIPWCHDGQIARLRGGINSINTDSFDLSPTILSVLLDSFANISFEARPEHATVTVRQKNRGGLRVIATGDFDACVDLDAIAIDWLVGAGRALVEPRLWAALSQRRQRALLRNIGRYIRPPRIFREYRSALVPLIADGIELAGSSWIGNAVELVDVCVNTWRPRIEAHLTPRGRATFFLSGRATPLWTISGQQG